MNRDAKRKVFLPTTAGINFKGLVIGIKGATKQELEKRFRSKISLRGIGAKYADGSLIPTTEPSHVLLEGSSQAVAQTATELERIFAAAQAAQAAQGPSLSAGSGGGGASAAALASKPKFCETFEATFTVPVDKGYKRAHIQIAMLIGKQGSNLREMERKAGGQGCMIKILDGFSEQPLVRVSAKSRDVLELAKVLVSEAMQMQPTRFYPFMDHDDRMAPLPEQAEEMTPPQTKSIPGATFASKPPAPVLGPPQLQQTSFTRGPAASQQPQQASIPPALQVPQQRQQASFPPTLSAPQQQQQRHRQQQQQQQHQHLPAPVQLQQQEALPAPSAPEPRRKPAEEASLVSATIRAQAPSPINTDEVLPKKAAPPATPRPKEPPAPPKVAPKVAVQEAVDECAVCLESLAEGLVCRLTCSHRYR
jgi:hypothetical protein